MSHFLSSRGPCAAKSAPLYIGAPYARVIVKASLRTQSVEVQPTIVNPANSPTTVRNMPYVENNNFRNFAFR